MQARNGICLLLMEPGTFMTLPPLGSWGTFFSTGGGGGGGGGGEGEGRRKGKEGNFKWS